MDPVSLAIATAVATKSTELIVDRGVQTWRRLLEVVKDRLGRDGEGANLLQGSCVSDLSTDEVRRLAEIITALRQRDRELDDYIQRVWQQVIELRQVNNTMTGTAGGHVLQAGNISGGVRLGQVTTRPTNNQP